MGYDWFKVHSEGILRGSLADSDDTTQMIWIKLLAMANETRSRDGHLWFAPRHPYDREFMAQSCHTTLPLFNYAVDVFVKENYTDGTPRLLIEDDGTLFIKNWEKYQAKVGKPKEGESPPLTKTARSALEREALDMVTTIRFLDKHPDMRELMNSDDAVKQRQVIDKLIELNKMSGLGDNRE